MSEPDSSTQPAEPRKSRLPRSWKLYLSLATVAAAIAGLAIEVIVTRPIRDSLNVYMSLISVANRPDYTDEERLAEARELCARHYLETHVLKLAPQGGLVGIPRNISKNFKAWREGPNIWICPTNRVGPIYQFVPEDGRWKFDGLVGLLRPWGEIIRSTDLQDVEVE
jgi:hypothetical protein